MKYFLLGIGALVIVVGVGYFIAKKTKPAVPEATPSVTSEHNVEQLADALQKKPTQTGKYVDYSDSIIADTEGIKILFFHAPWCPQCRALDASIKVGSIPAGVTIIKTDYDSHQSLRQKYGVTIQTTLVRVDDSGDAIKKYVAYDSPTLENVIVNLIR